MRDGTFFSIYSGISFVISCTVDSLNWFGMPTFLLAGLMGRGGVTTVHLLFPLRSCIGSHSWMGLSDRDFYGPSRRRSLFHVVQPYLEWWDSRFHLHSVYGCRVEDG